jgi:hypothetical protein
MAFPVGPINGQIAVINGIRYTYNSTASTWTRISSAKYTAAASVPSNASTGDRWYNTSEDVLYEYVNDGYGSYWLDIQTGFVGGSSTGLLSNTTIAGTLTMTGNIVPSANVTYSLGTSTQRFKDLFLSGNTIDLGGATIKTDAASGAIALIPQPTVANPNPMGIVVSAAGTVSTVSTTGGTLATNAISNSSNTAVTTNTTTFGNITANGNVVTANVYADRFFYSNGTAFSSSSYGNIEVAAYLSSTSGLGSVTQGLVLPNGTTEQRPAIAANGTMRYNSSTNLIEAFFGNVWVSLAQASYIASYLVVAGGGGGGVQVGGGGGGGGVQSGTISVFSGQSYAIVVGGGGTPTTSTSSPGGKGANSTIGGSTVIAQGGGGGGSYGANNGATTGGSGGGAGAGTSGSTTGAAGIAGQGFAGGDSVRNAWSGGGGGGAGGVGSPGSGQIGGNGGIGFQSNITGSLTYYGGGGGGCSETAQSTLSSGGLGGGGGGWSTNFHPGTDNNGLANTGGGGGGKRDYPAADGPGSAGGGGIVIISYPGLPRTNSGLVTQGNGYTIHTFTGTSNFIA